MASSKQLLLLAVVAAVACLTHGDPASATVWMVGDELGWRAKFNQTGWTDGKTFLVGDSLMFMYPKESHTVAQVSKDDFAACNLQGNFLAGPWTSGNDVVTLDKPGKAWFICTKPNHCTNGMKLVVDVVSTTAPAPSPVPWTFPFPAVPASPAVPATPAAKAPSPWFHRSPFFPGAPAAAAPSPWFRSPFFPGGPAAAPSPYFRSTFPWWRGSATAPTPELPVAAPPSAAVRNSVGGAVAAAVAAIVAIALAF